MDFIIPNRRLRISENVRQFLSSNRSREGWWWIDQVSIDQENTGERNEQVKIMQDIYAGAQKVVIWLTGLSASTELVLNLRLDQAVLTAEATLVEHLLAAQDLLTHPYWSRIWTIQEVAYARKVDLAYGSGKIRFQRLQEVVAKTDRSSIRLPLQFMWFMQHATTLSSHSSQDLHRMDEIVRTFSDSGCKDPRDKVFGTQGLLKREQRIPVDYTRSTQAVYFDAIQMMANQWPPDQPMRDLVSVCLQLGVQMLPDVFVLHLMFDQFDEINSIMRAEGDQEEKKARIVEALHRLIPTLKPTSTS